MKLSPKKYLFSKKPIFGLFFLLVAIVLVANACTKDQAKEPGLATKCAPIMPTYNSSVKFILNSNCAFSGCHDAGTQADGINLSDYANAKVESENGKIVCSVTSNGCTPMPLSAAPLSDSLITELQCWAFNGSPQ